MNWRTMVLAFGVFLVAAASAQTAEPGWYGRPILFGEEREQIRSMDMLDRPYRPLHFYGNTARRRYYRGTTTVAPRDVVRGSLAVVRDYTRP